MRGSCTQAQGRQCFRLGKLRLRGGPPQLDLVEAARAHEAGCKSFAPACAGLALQVQDGRGVAYDPKRAISLYQQACDQGAGIGCFNIAVMYLDGNGVERDEAKAKALFAKAATLYEGECAIDPSWCTNLAYLHDTGLLASGKDPAAALAWNRKGCDRGDQPACVGIGQHELDGDGVTKDRDRALARFRAACDAGDWYGCSALVSATDPDLKDPATTVPLVLRACDLGSSHSCGYAGSLVRDGAAGPPDVGGGEALIARGCDLGSPIACMDRGDALKLTDPAAAARFYEKACHIGLADGCLGQAALAVDGKVPGDARALVTTACRLGSRQACDMLANTPPAAPP
jgi:uncharacterized protein